MNDRAHLPAPDAQALALAQALTQRIAERIRAAGGVIGFDAYMRLALYEPGLGYYAGGAHKFGRFAADGSDFVTAPELTPLFGAALARQVEEVCAQSAPAVLEFGAGSGRLAADLLGALGDACAEYAIVELSGSLRERQRARIARDAAAHLHKVRWLDALPERFRGCVIGNEVLDAMPVRLVERTATHAPQPWAERCVGLDGERLCWITRPADARLLDAIARAIPAANALPAGYLTELREEDPAFAATIARLLERGAALFLDYGFPAAELYHPQRIRGTLMCHVRHRAHDDALWHPGLQDITAHVDFSAVARAAIEAGAELAGYTTQARLLMNCGILELLAATGAPGTLPYARATGAMLRLLSESEMGELFKAIAFTRGIAAPLSGFVCGDRAGEL